MQEKTRPVPNERANMAFQTRPRTLRHGAVLPLALLGLLPVGCAKPSPPALTLVGTWRGTMASGNAAVPSVWEVRADGTQSMMLTLPQGAMTAEGTWAAQGSILTQRTTIRIVVLGGERKAVVLASPMETTFAYQLQGDTLTLTHSGTRQQIVLTREDGGKGG